MMTNGRETVRIGIVGCGAIAQSYLQVLPDCPGVRCVAATDVRAEAARAFAEKSDCHAYTSHEEMADREALDAVIVCAPPAAHPHIAIDLLERKVHVLCEKPLSICSRDAKRMVASARRNGVVLNMASKFRYMDDVIRTRELISGDELGDVILFENAFTSRVNMADRWNSDAVISGGGVLIDNGTHSLDLMRYLVGPLAEVQVVEGKRTQGLAVDETVHIFANTVENVMGSIALSWSIAKELESYVQVYGSEGTAILGWKQSRYIRHRVGEWRVIGSGYNKLQGIRNQLRNFAAGIQGKERLLTTMEDALASVHAVEAAYSALRRNSWVAVGELADAACA
jgi:predicted dehydrogenase